MWSRSPGSYGKIERESDAQQVEREITTPDELLKALKRYLEESGESERVVASQIPINHHTLRRWLSDKQSPKKGKLALAALFLRRAGYL